MDHKYMNRSTSKSVERRPVSVSNPKMNNLLLSRSNIHVSTKKPEKKAHSAPHKEKSSKKESGWGVTIKKGASWAASKAWDYLWRHLFGASAKQIQLLQTKLDNSRRTDWQYFGKDSKDKKDDSDSTKLLLAEINLVKSSMRQAMGFKPMQIVLTIPFQLTATVTSGVLNGTVSIVPGTSSEFSSLAVLFDEYKCQKGDVKFVNYIRAGYAFGVTGSTLNNSTLALVYDTDSTALTSVLNATEFLQHRLYRIGQQAGGVQSFEKSLETFEFRVPPGVGVDTITPIVESGEWIPTTNTSSTVGFIKSYCQTTEVVALAVVSGYVQMHCEFRSRQ